MSVEYVVDLLEYDFSACEVVRTWQEVWPSLASLEYATWDQSSCEVTCETRAPQSGCCSSYGVDGYALEYTTYNFRTCASSTACETIPPCDTITPPCGCTPGPRFWTFTLSGVCDGVDFATMANPPTCASYNRTWVLEYGNCYDQTQCTWGSPEYLRIWPSTDPDMAVTPVVAMTCSFGGPPYTLTIDIYGRYTSGGVERIWYMARYTASAPRTGDSNCFGPITFTYEDPPNFIPSVPDTHCGCWPVNLTLEAL